MTARIEYFIENEPCSRLEFFKRQYSDRMLWGNCYTHIFRHPEDGHTVMSVLDAQRMMALQRAEHQGEGEPRS